MKPRSIISENRRQGTCTIYSTLGFKIYIQLNPSPKWCSLYIKIFLFRYKYTAEKYK